ncbi:hypothetical protein QGM71_15155 [Virgibacillus sp. C22-A2]|uniref:Uncharacterized protein n=1 Tax=Virgibacillus tibetensis TaxID=3042313 RepID=A0ABU6KI27_9BACI|nr:hypothetical protein [Virgibacillus sp. C22-A2]
MFILGIGITADIIPLRITIAVSAISMFAASLVFSAAVIKSLKKKFYLEENEVV